MRYAIALVVLFLAWVPLAFIGYGALGAVMGLALLAPLIAAQVIVLRWLQKRQSRN
jgi:hypothetical protein